MERCKQCGITLAGKTDHFCQVCWSVLESLDRAYWHRLHGVWVAENAKLKAEKLRLMQGGRVRAEDDF